MKADYKISLKVWSLPLTIAYMSDVWKQTKRIDKTLFIGILCCNAEFTWSTKIK